MFSTMYVFRTTSDEELIKKLLTGLKLKIKIW